MSGWLCLATPLLVTLVKHLGLSYSLLIAIYSAILSPISFHLCHSIPGFVNLVNHSQVILNDSTAIREKHGRAFNIIPVEAPNGNSMF